MARPRLSDASLLALQASMPAPAEAPAPAAFIYKPRREFIPSPQQAAIFDWQVNGSGSAFVEAVAGAGKTTTLIEALKRCEGSVFFGAYGNKAAADIKAKAAKARVDRQGIFLSTMHGAANSAWRRSEKGKRSALDTKGEKMRGIIRDMANFGDPTILLWEGFITKMCSLGKQLLMGIKQPADDRAAWEAIADRFGCENGLPDDISEEERAAAYDAVEKVFAKSIAMCPQLFDFDDMIYAPLFYNVRFFQNDWVFIDEAQDTNPARREVARRMLKPAGRLIAVGDPRQAIFGFTGADADAVEQIIRDFRCTRLPLTITYRCPKAVVAFAQQWVSHIEAHPDAPEGEVRQIAPQAALAEGEKAQRWFQREAIQPADAILCRYTKPLIEAAFALLREGIGCKVEGRDIGNGLMKLAQRWRTTRIETLVERLATYRKREIEKAMEKNDEGRATSIGDICDTLSIFIARCQEKGLHRIADLVAEIQSLFADDVAGVVTLSTGHKAKGREWPRVFWLQKKGGFSNLQAWEMVQEDNIKYVIATRSMAFLGIVPEGLA